MSVDRRISIATGLDWSRESRVIFCMSQEEAVYLRSPNQLCICQYDSNSGRGRRYVPSNDRIMHDRLVRLILEVAVPTASKFWRRPLVHLGEFLFSWTNLDTSINTIGSEWASALEVPFIEDSFLDFGHTSDEVIEALTAYILLAIALAAGWKCRPGLARYTEKVK